MASEKSKDKIEAKKLEKEFLKKRKRKIVTIEITFIVAIASIIGGFILYANLPKGGNLVAGFKWAPEYIDPLQGYDYTCSDDLIDQVAEGLFDYDLASEDLRIIPNLATSYSWNEEATELTCTLRQGVTFHDGISFNAQTVKWNFDRLYSMIDNYGVFGIAVGYLYLLPDFQWIISETQVIDDFTVKFVLNAPYAPFLSLLCHQGSYILSPTSTPQDQLIDTLTGELVGTGAFIYDSYEPDVEINLSPNPYYWGGKPALDGLTFSFIWDEETRHNALISGDVDFLLRPSFVYDPKYIDNFREAGIIINEGLSGEFEFIWMNNNQIPVQMRKAISYAIDYDYIIHEIMGGFVARARSPIPKGMLYSNTVDFEVPVLDLNIARQTLIDSGLYGELPAMDNNFGWENLATNNPIAVYNFTYNWGAVYREEIMLLIQDNLAKIGVNITAAKVTYFEFISRGYELGGLHRDMLQLYSVGWIPDYNDPSTLINALYSNKELFNNWAQVDDLIVQQLMEEALVETEPVARELLYYKIQERLIEEVYPAALAYVNINYDAWVPNLRGFHTNAFEKPSFKTVYFI